MTTTTPKRKMLSIFDQAAKVFDGWTDPDTGVRVLRIHTRGAAEDGVIWSTPYHQCRCFLDGGRKMLLHTEPRAGNGENASLVLDLTTGQTERPFPPGYSVGEVCDGTYLASLIVKEADGYRALIWDLRAGREMASFAAPGWDGPAINFLSDHRRAVVLTYRRMGEPLGDIGPYDKPKIYAAPIQSRHYLLAPGAAPRLLFEADGYFCNHVQGCPTDPDLYAYDRWPTPKRDVPQVTHLRSLDGRIDQPVPLADDALRPGDMWGARDHYVWTPDGRRIVSYLCPQPIEVGRDFNHFKLEWWLSALDRRTGEDLAARYPAGRWGGHMQMSPDSRYILCGGGPGFDKLFAVAIEGLRQGWNEHVICSYPHTVSRGDNADRFPYPFALPDRSGVIFNAGWPGPEHGVYLAEWPAALP